MKKSRQYPAWVKEREVRLVQENHPVGGELFDF
jgi:hypothetical protein